jgi:uncharacterized damage-inducible protein DinB
MRGNDLAVPIELTSVITSGAAGTVPQLGSIVMGRTPTDAGTSSPASEKTTSSTADAGAADRSGPQRTAPVDLGRALIEAYLTNERINQVLLDAIDAKIWRAAPPCSKRRNIATSFAHMHNVRCMRLAMSAPDQEPPARLDRAEVTAGEAKEALAKSAAAMVRLIERSLPTGGHVDDHRPDVVALVCVAITHDAHHRGQICHWARQLGAPLTPEQALKMWEWDKRWKEAVLLSG